MGIVEKQLLIVIADDITGAAEMAGIAHQAGLPTRLQLVSVTAHLQPIITFLSSEDTLSVLVLATDTRGMSEDEAVAETRRICRYIGDTWQQVCLFKKTDSALRGHVMAELRTTLDETPYWQAVYMPANPSKERIIKDGTYYIKGVPLHQTAFSYDPEFPATSSRLEKRLPGIKDFSVTDTQSSVPLVSFANAVSQQDIAHLVAHLPAGTLLAGAADLFSAWLNTMHHSASATNTASDNTAVPALGKESDASLLLLCGSTQSRSLDLGIPEYPMPRTVYDGVAPISEWLQPILSQQKDTHSLILSFGTNTHRTGKDAAVYLRNAMSEVAESLVERHCPDELIIEGGATAFCLLNRLGWTQFRIVNEIAPGVVRMEVIFSPSAPARHASPVYVTLKPGSYPWGTLWQQ